MGQNLSTFDSRQARSTSSAVSARFNNYFRDGVLMRVRRPTLAVGSARSSCAKPQNFLIGISSYYSGLPRLSRRGGFHDEIQTNHGASYGRLWGAMPRTQDVWSESAVPMHLSNKLPPAVSARRRLRRHNSPYIPRLRRGQVEGASMVPAAVFLGLFDPPRRGYSSAGAPLATRVWR